MSELESLFDNTAFVVNLVISLILLVVFLRLAWNVGKIKNYLLKENPDLILKDAERLEFLGKNSEAIDAYLNYIYYLKNQDIDAEEKRSGIAKAIKCIEMLDGTVPENIKRAY